ncbi:MAG: hypothetical protein AVO39_04780 [delta proteobacterium MLS_D]|jgi:hypothetical protein|nr:MAG: hypothetical protein AVO39_04780 [delta proteobacterium MLS_D]
MLSGATSHGVKADIMTERYDRTGGRFDVIRRLLEEIIKRPPTARADPLEQLNAVFLDALCSRNGQTFQRSVRTLAQYAEAGGKNGVAAEFFLQALHEIPNEIEQYAGSSATFAETLARAGDMLAEDKSPSEERRADICWSIFFPEGRRIRGREEEAAADLRMKRTVKVTKFSSRPIKDPFTEILFTANVLLTIPLHEKHLENIPLPIRETVEQAEGERQLFWYDHPVPIGVPAENNEIVYGLRGLDDALDFEMRRGNLDESVRVSCLLSVSVTHEKLREAAKDWIGHELSRHHLKHLAVYVFTETDTKRLVDEVLVPAGRRFVTSPPVDDLRGIFGVDGEYGRHYSFLKAVAALMSVMVDRRIGATFKIDLDQVFPQEQLVHETGRSAFEHLASSLWGAVGRDAWGREVELGMIAGALVNERDISRSLFTPDVTFPDEPPRFDEMVFFSRLPQALSTEAEMMTRYDGAPLDGETTCLQRIHVTGGVTGILLESLRKHRPFTPTFIGRAEDQAWLLSVLFSGERPLRYVHQDGLFMRHDKESFAADAVRTAAMGKLVGDYARILNFSRYARALPWQVEDIKEEVDPFTGCFISPIPVTLTVLRLSLRAERLFREGAVAEAVELLRLGSARLHPLIDESAENNVIKLYERERTAWDYYYDVLDRLEKAIDAGDAAAIRLKEKTEQVFRSCRV